MSADLMPGEKYLYLAEIPGVGTKVGVSHQPIKRLAQHARDARAYGRTIARTWVSPTPHANALDNERAIRGSSEREYLNRPFGDCLRQAAGLPMERAVPTGRSPLNQFLVAWLPSYGEWLDKEDAR